MKDRTGQKYDEVALADPQGARASYDANLLAHLDPRVSLNISGAVGRERPAARCLTGFSLSGDAACERCGASAGQACLSADAGTAGATAGNRPSPVAPDPDHLLIESILRSRASRTGLAGRS